MVDCDFTMTSCVLPIVNEFDFLSFSVLIKHFTWNRSYVITARSQQPFNLSNSMRMASMLPSDVRVISKYSRQLHLMSPLKKLEMKKDPLPAYGQRKCFWFPLDGDFTFTITKRILSCIRIIFYQVGMFSTKLGIFKSLKKNSGWL